MDKGCLRPFFNYLQNILRQVVKRGFAPKNEKKKKTVALTRNILGNSLILLNTSICIICKSDDEGHLTGWIIIKQKKKKRLIEP